MTWPLFAFPRGHPTISRVVKGTSGWTMFLRDPTGDEDRTMLPAVLKIDGHDDLTIRCILFNLAYPEGNGENPQEG